MITNLKELLSRTHTLIEETPYDKKQEEMLDYSIVSGDFYDIKPNCLGEKKIRFKNTVNISDFEGIIKRVPALAQADFPDKEQIPYFTANLKKLQEALKENRKVAVEGGPCLFGAHEVDVEIVLKNGTTCFFDYCTGKRYGKSGKYSEENMENFIKEHMEEIDQLLFHDKKKGLTHQEYDSILCVFEAAEALGAPAVIPLPDMSYIKYLSAVLSDFPEEKREQILKDFRKVSWRISDLYIELIHSLEIRYPAVNCVIVHERDVESCRCFFEERAPYIERNKILRTITAIEQRLESVKDYISMPALPFYLLGIRDILEIDSVDETDSFRKCAKAHKGTINLSCILYPEKLSEDGRNTIYHAEQEFKEYL